MRAVVSVHCLDTVCDLQSHARLCDPLMLECACTLCLQQQQRRLQ
jgi:hypothetical protein